MYLMWSFPTAGMGRLGKTGKDLNILNTIRYRETGKLHKALGTELFELGHPCHVGCSLEFAASNLKADPELLGSPTSTSLERCCCRYELYQEAEVSSHV
jgi:hypothetical protein